MQILRGLIMSTFLMGYPIFMCFYLIPYTAMDSNGNINNDSLILFYVSIYLIIILILQIFGSYRGLISFYQKQTQLFKLNIILLYIINYLNYLEN